MCWFLLGWRSGAYYFGSLWPWHWILASFLGFSCLEHISYITANFSQMCLMLDQFLWGHLSCYCDISCFFSLGSKRESHADWCKSLSQCLCRSTVLQFNKWLLEFDDIILIYKIWPPPSKNIQEQYFVNGIQWQLSFNTQNIYISQTILFHGLHFFFMRWGGGQNIMV